MSLSKKGGNIPCDSCELFFNEKKDFLLHVYQTHGKPLFKCLHCEELFKFNSILKRYVKAKVCLKKEKLKKKRTWVQVENDDEDDFFNDIQTSVFKCARCKKVFTRMENLKAHQRHSCSNKKA
jgi:uncharacterized C2H2 Zn-finger protein